MTHLLCNLLLALTCASAFAADYYVNNVEGNDDHDGLSKQAAFRTLAKGVAAIGAGDTLHLADTGVAYRESLDFYGHPGGEEGKPVTVDGHGAWLTGADPCPPDGWQPWEGETLQRQDLVTRGFMLIDGEMVYMTHSFNVLEPGEFCYMPYMHNRLYFHVPAGKKPVDFTIEVGQPDGTSVTLEDKWQHSHSSIGAVRRYNGLEAPTWIKVDGEPVALVTAKTRLQPGQWTVEDKILYFRPDRPVAEMEIEVITRGNGVAMNGNPKHFVFRNLNVRHVYNDGYNIHGNVKDAAFYNCNARDCGDEGFSSHDTCETLLDGAVYINCDNGIANVNACISVTRNVLIRDSRHVGLLLKPTGDGHHTAENIILIDNPSQLSADVLTAKNVLILRTSEGPRTGALGIGRETTIDQLTVIGNSSLLRADQGLTITNAVFGPGQGGFHARTDEPQGLFKLDKVTVAPDLDMTWGARHPWERAMLGDWLGDQGLDVTVSEMPFAEPLCQGKAPATMPERGCSPDLIQRWLDHHQQHGH